MVEILPIIEPLIKLVPIIKLKGNFTVSFIKKFMLLLLVLFCIPIINKRNNEELKVIAKKNFLNVKGIYLLVISSLI